MKQPYNVNNFWGTLKNDIWMLKKISELPTNPPPEMGSTYDEKTGITNNFVHHIDDICMDARHDAVSAYRKQLAPIIFSLAQKVYAEVFRLVLGESGINVGNSQFDVEEKIIDILKKSPTDLVVSPVFKNRAEFDDWWDGRYRYHDFREARNQITHDLFGFDGDTLVVKNKKDNVVLNWTTDEVFSFAESVVAKARKISMIWSQGVEEQAE